MHVPTTFIIGNWKMNTTLDEAQALLSELSAASSSVQVGIAPPMPWVVPLRQALPEPGIWIGAQQAVPTATGAFSGDVSVSMISPYVDFVLIGHSEQRLYHPAPQGTFAQTVQTLLTEGKTAVLCVGENQEVRDAGRARDHVGAQLEDGIPDTIGDGIGRLIVAYEPVWAIGTSRAASADDAEEMAGFIHDWCTGRFGRSVPVLYGGSATEDNALEFLTQTHVSGLLVGSASLHADRFNRIVAAAEVAIGH
ncbi:MAG: triose-phosphate isomerase [Thermomicrobiales bacterium]